MQHHTAAITTGPGATYLGDRVVPTLKPGWIRAEVIRAGICGSDIAINAGPFPGRVTLPRVLGHEFTARVIDVGSDSRFRAGDRIVCEEILWCGRCDGCRRGHFDNCTAAEELGFTVDGAFGELINLPADHCFQVPDELSDASACLVEPLSVAYNGVHGTGRSLRAGEAALVLGLGPIGACAALWLAAAGCHVIGTDVNAERVELIRDLGVDARLVDGTSADLALEFAAANGGIDMIAEAAGDHAVGADVMTHLRPGGKVVLLGHTSLPTRLPTELLVLRSASIEGSCGQVGKATYELVMKSLARGVISPDGLVTQAINLDMLPNTLTKPDRQHLKIQLVS